MSRPKNNTPPGTYTTTIGLLIIFFITPIFEIYIIGVVECLLLEVPLYIVNLLEGTECVPRAVATSSDQREFCIRHVPDENAKSWEENGVARVIFVLQ